jgi:hypothetical protein
MSKLPKIADESKANGLADASRVVVLRISRPETLFRTLVYCETLRCHCTVVFTQTHLAWAPLRTVALAPWVAMFRPRDYLGVEWRAVNAIDFEFRAPNHEKLIRIAWSPNEGDIGGLEFTRIMQFNDWFVPFREVGFSPIGGNPFRVTSLRGFLVDYGPAAWVLLFAVLGFLFFAFARNVLFLYLCVFHFLAIPLWLLAARKARAWFPSGASVHLEREK